MSTAANPSQKPTSSEPTGIGSIAGNSNLVLAVAAVVTLFVIWAAAALFSDFLRNTRSFDFFASYDLDSTDEVPRMVVSFNISDFAESPAGSSVSGNLFDPDPSTLRLSLAGFSLRIDPASDVCIERIYVEHLTWMEKMFRFSEKEVSAPLENDTDNRTTDDLDLTEFSLAPAPIIEFNDLCSHNGYLNHLRFPEYSYIDEDAVVNNWGISDTTQIQSSQLIEFSRLNTNGRWFYPFDHFAKDLFVQVQGTDPNGNPFTLAPEIALFSNLNDVSERASFEKVVFPEASESVYRLGGEVTNVSIRVMRPFATRLLTILFGLAAFLFILSLFLIKDMGSALEVAVAILLGLWGIRSVLLPDSIQANNVVNSGFMFLYLTLAWTAAMRFLVLPVYKRSKQSSSGATDKDSQAGNHDSPDVSSPDRKLPPSSAPDETVRRNLDHSDKSAAVSRVHNGSWDGNSSPSGAAILVALSSVAMMIAVLRYWFNRHSGAGP